jgi:hypothetical protein
MQFHVTYVKYKHKHEPCQLLRKKKSIKHMDRGKGMESTGNEGN